MLESNPNTKKGEHLGRRMGTYSSRSYPNPQGDGNAFLWGNETLALARGGRRGPPPDFCFCSHVEPLRAAEKLRVEPRLGHLLLAIKNHRPPNNNVVLPWFFIWSEDLPQPSPPLKVLHPVRIPILYASSLLCSQ